MYTRINQLEVIKKAILLQDDLSIVFPIFPTWVNLGCGKEREYVEVVEGF